MTKRSSTILTILCSVFFAALLLYLVFANNAVEVDKHEILKSFRQTICILSALTCVAVAIFLLFLKDKESLCEKLVPAIAFLLGLLYLVSITPLSVPDEGVHFFASYQLSNYVLNKEDKTSFEGEYTDFQGFTAHQNTPEAYLRVIEGFNAERSDLGATSADYLSGIWSLYYFAEYIPQVLGVSLGRIFRFNLIRTFYLGRLFNLLFYVLCLNVAMKQTPRFKLPLGLCAVTPMALQQAASLSYDCFINGMSFVVLALFMKSCTDEGKFTLTEFVGLLIPLMLLSPAKGAYAFLMFLFLFIPLSRFKSRKQKTLYFFSLIFLCAAFMLLVLLPCARRVLTEAHKLEIGAGTPSLQKLKVVVNSFFYYFFSWIVCGIGMRLSGLNLMVPDLYILGFIVLLLFSAQITDDGMHGIRLEVRFAMLIIYSAVAVAFLVSMLFTWYESNSVAIVGVQGRYFIPVFPLLLYALSFKCKLKGFRYEKITVFAWTVISSAVVFQIVNYTVNLYA